MYENVRVRECVLCVAVHHSDRANDVLRHGLAHHVVGADPIPSDAFCSCIDVDVDVSVDVSSRDVYQVLRRCTRGGGILAVLLDQRDQLHSLERWSAVMDVADVDRDRTLQSPRRRRTWCPCAADSTPTQPLWPCSARICDVVMWACERENARQCRE